MLGQGCLRVRFWRTVYLHLKMGLGWVFVNGLKWVQRRSGPISRDIAIVSLRCSLSRDTFSAIPAIPPQGAIPPLGAFFYTDISVRYPILQHIARYLCHTPGKQARRSFAILTGWNGSKSGVSGCIHYAK